MLSKIDYTLFTSNQIEEFNRSTNKYGLLRKLTNNHMYICFFVGLTEEEGLREFQKYLKFVEYNDDVLLVEFSNYPLKIDEMPPIKRVVKEFKGRGTY